MQSRGLLVRAVQWVRASKVQLNLLFANFFNSEPILSKSSCEYFGSKLFNFGWAKVVLWSRQIHIRWQMKSCSDAEKWTYWRKPSEISDEELFRTLCVALLKCSPSVKPVSRVVFCDLKLTVLSFVFFEANSWNSSHKQTFRLHVYSYISTRAFSNNFWKQNIFG